MITLCRAEERRHIRRDHGEFWLSFFPQDPSAPLADAIELLNEGRLPPAAGVALRPRRGLEIITYVCEGVLAQTDGIGRASVIHPGEFQCRTVERGVRQRVTNASQTEWAHVFQICLRPAEPVRGPSQEQKHFTAADRRGMLCLVASPDGERGSLHIHRDVMIYSALLDRGRHVIHELSPGRSAWLHLVHGEATLSDVVLTTGDGASVTADRAVSLTALADSEILVLDIDDRRTRSTRPCTPSN